MKREAVVLMLGILSFSAITFASPEWVDYSGGIKERNVLSLVMHPSEANLIFCGTDRAVYVSKDGGKNWREVFRPSGAKKEINYLYIDPASPDEIYAATGSGLFVSNDSGITWKKNFSGMGKLEEECLVVSVYRGIFFLGTRKTLFLSFDRGKTWQKAGGIPNDSQVIDIAIDNDEVYLATSTGIYREGEDWDDWEKILTSLSRENDENGNHDEVIEEEGVSGQSKINRVVIDPRDYNRISIATSEGILKSEDKGETWQDVSSVGLLSREVRGILISRKDGRQFAATKKGAYVFAENRWQQLHQGLVVEESNVISEDSEGKIWLGGKGGIFKLATEDAAHLISPASGQIDFYFKDEPAIQELQKVAIDYAEVAPEKIKRWRWQAQIKAIMPEVSVDYDKTVTTALGATYDRVSVGPMDWGVNLKWNVGELIWNNDQTSIDSRSKLMVELRDDIINELTRLYFERRRLQMEMGQLSSDATGGERAEKELRLQELTALIDGLTGGYLSWSLKKTKM
jgi:photosystem II stability/assembly factor-like uncharacterized protein